MIEDMKLSTLLRSIADPDNPITFSRWGIGEWQAVLGKHAPGACWVDGHSFFPAMRTELKQVLCDYPGYLLGAHPKALKLYGIAISQLLSRCLGAEVASFKVRWISSEIFLDAARRGRRREIVEVAQSRKLLVVGPPPLKHLKNSGLRYWKFVEVPPRNAYLAISDIYRQVLAVAESQPEPLLISISAGIPAEILCHQLYNRFGSKHTIIDFGSLWHPMVGVQPRGEF